MTITTQPFVNVNIGSAPNDGTGDDLRTAFDKVNQNFANIGNIGFQAKNIQITGAVESSGSITTTGNVSAAYFIGQSSTSNLTVSGSSTVNKLTASGNVIFGNTYVPSANNSTGTTGQIVWDSNYVYVCIATNIWKRATLNTW